MNHVLRRKTWRVGFVQPPITLAAHQRDQGGHGGIPIHAGRGFHHPVLPQHRAGGDAALLLGNTPVLDPDFCAIAALREHRDIAGRLQAAGDLQIGIGNQPALFIPRHAGNKIGGRYNAEASDNQIGWDFVSAGEPDRRDCAFSFQSFDFCAQMEFNTFLFVNPPENAADFGAVLRTVKGVNPRCVRSASAWSADARPDKAVRHGWRRPVFRPAPASNSSQRRRYSAPAVPRCGRR